MIITEQQAQQIVSGLKAICRKAGQAMDEETRVKIQERIDKRKVN